MIQAAFIDTEGTFRPERIREIAARFGVDADAACENILVARAYNSEHQMSLISEIAARFAEERGVFKLLVRLSHLLFSFNGILLLSCSIFLIILYPRAINNVHTLKVIDSIIALFRTDYCGRGELSERQQKLNQMLSRLAKISEEYNVAVFITNQVTRV